MLLAEKESKSVFPNSRLLRITRRSGSGAWADVLSGLELWRLWSRLGWNDILQRYRRSLLGPFWLTASMAIMVVALGVLYAQLFQQSIDDFLPHFCVGLLVWTLMASYLTESGTLFTGSESYIKQIALPFSVYVYRFSWSKLIIFAHNFVIYLGVLLYFRIWPGAVGFLGLAGLLIVVVNGMAASLTIGMISARFRDLPQVIASVVQIIFFITPIFWKADALNGRHAYVIDFNPFFHLVQVVRAPLLGEYPTASNYRAVLLITLINVSCAAWFFSRFRTRIAYWI